MDNIEAWALGIATLALVVAVASFFIKGKTVIEYREDLMLSTIRKINGIENEVKRIDRQKVTLVKKGKTRRFKDDEGNIFGKHIID